MDSDQQSVIKCRCGYSCMWMEYETYWKCAACGAKLVGNFIALDEKDETEIRRWSRLKERK